METITIVLPTEIRLALEEIERTEGVAPGEIVGEALREYLFFRQFRLLRERMVAKAQAQGIYSEEDVFRQVS